MKNGLISLDLDVYVRYQQMPGGGQYLMRSRMLWTLSADRMCLSCDMGLLGIPFGLLFSVTGIVLLVLTPYLLISQLAALPIWKSLVFVPVALLIGSGHLCGGAMCLWRQRTTLDRRQRTLSTRHGWLGIIRDRLSLDEIASIRVSRVKRPFFYHSSLDMIFEVSLVANDDRSITVGYASTKPLAADIENELRCFLSK